MGINTGQRVVTAATLKDLLPQAVRAAHELGFTGYKLVDIRFHEVPYEQRGEGRVVCCWKCLIAYQIPESKPEAKQAVNE